MTDSDNRELQIKAKTRRLVIKLSIMVIAMFGVGYALVPFYSVLCKSLGINGKTSGQAVMAQGAVDKSRTITIQFLATQNAYIPWDFRPKTRTIRLHPGENKLVAFYAKNNTDHAMTVQAIPSVTPGIAARYLKKTECFCFTQQKMQGKEGMDWPLLFHIDNDLPKNIHTITLAYTLFDVTKSTKEVPKTSQGHL